MHIDQPSADYYSGLFRDVRGREKILFFIMKLNTKYSFDLKNGDSDKDLTRQG